MNYIFLDVFFGSELAKSISSNSTISNIFTYSNLLYFGVFIVCFFFIAIFSFFVIPRLFRNPQDYFNRYIIVRSEMQKIDELYETNLTKTFYFTLL